MIASEKGGRGAEKHRGRSAFIDRELERSMWRLLDLGAVQARSRYVSTGPIELHLLDAGSGAAIVLLHGAGGGAANWYRLMGPLAKRFRVISFDLPGFGFSASVKPRAPLGRNVALLMQEALQRLAVQPTHIMGTSFGGLVAARLAQLTNPRSLTLVDPAGLWREAALGLRLACNPLLQRIPLKQSRAGVRWLFRHVLITRRLSLEHETALVDYIYWSALRTDRSAMARAYSLFAGLRGQSEVLSSLELQELAPRTLILWGEQDHFLPAPENRRAAALATGAQLRIIPNAGHSPNWEAPGEVLNEILDFIGR